MASVAATALTVPTPYRETVDQFVSRLAASLPAAGCSIVAYGSAVRGGFVAGQSDLNLLVILPAVSPAALDAVAEAAVAGRRRGLSPVVLAVGELPALADEAPLVLWDVADRRLVLHGDDPIAALEFSHEALWRQLTFELRDKLLGLRQLQVSGQRPRPPEVFGRRVATSLLHLFRAALRLYGRPADQNRVAAIGDVARFLGLDLAALQRFHSACYGDDARSLRDLERIIADGQALLTAALGKLAALDPAALPLTDAQPDAPAAKMAPAVAEALAAETTAAESLGEEHVAADETVVAEPAGAVAPALPEAVADEPVDEPGPAAGEDGGRADPTVVADEAGPAAESVAVEPEANASPAAAADAPAALLPEPVGETPDAGEAQPCDGAARESS